MSHYFSEKQDVKSDRKIIKYEIENKKFEFLTDNGVFSKTKRGFWDRCYAEGVFTGKFK